MEKTGQRASAGHRSHPALSRPVGGETALDLIPQGLVDDWQVLAVVGFILVRYPTQVDLVSEQVVQRAPAIADTSPDVASWLMSRPC